MTPRIEREATSTIATVPACALATIAISMDGGRTRPDFAEDCAASSEGDAFPADSEVVAPECNSINVRKRAVILRICFMGSPLYRSADFIVTVTRVDSLFLK